MFLLLPSLHLWVYDMHLPGRKCLWLFITLPTSWQEGTIDWRRSKEKAKNMDRNTHPPSKYMLLSCNLSDQMVFFDSGRKYQVFPATHPTSWYSSSCSFQIFLKNALRASADIPTELITDWENYSVARRKEEETHSSCSRSSNVQISLQLFLALALPRL